MRYSFCLISVLLLSACSKSIEIPGLDIEKWNETAVCSEYRIEGAALIEENDETLLGLTQADIEAVFGAAPRHQLWNRNEKFFYYPVTKDCGEETKNTSLFIRFDALGRAKEVLVLLDD